MTRRLSKMYKVKWKIRSVDPELPRPTCKAYYTVEQPVYSAIPQGNSQDLICNNLQEAYIVVGDTQHDFVILDYK